MAQPDNSRFITAVIPIWVTVVFAFMGGVIHTSFFLLIRNGRFRQISKHVCIRHKAARFLVAIKGKQSIKLDAN